MIAPETVSRNLISRIRMIAFTTARICLSDGQPSRRDRYRCLGSAVAQHGPEDIESAASKAVIRQRPDLERQDEELQKLLTASE